MATLAENAAAVKAAQEAIDAAIVAKGGTTEGGLTNAAAAIAALPSGDSYVISNPTEIDDEIVSLETKGYTGEFDKYYFPNAIEIRDSNTWRGNPSVLEVDAPLATYIDSFQRSANLRKVVAPNLQNGSFEQCFRLEEVNFPLAVYCRLRHCASLRRAILPLATSADFYGCAKLKEIYLPSLVVGENEFFSNCVSLTRCSMPSFNGPINDMMFIYCASLEQVEFGRITSVSTTAFRGCGGKLTSMTFAMTKDELRAVTNYGQLWSQPYSNIGGQKLTIHCTDGDIDYAHRNGD